MVVSSGLRGILIQVCPLCWYRQTLSDNLPMSHASVPCGIVPTSRRCRIMATSPIRHLVVPCHQLSSYGRWVLCVAGLSVWNSLLDSLQNPVIGRNSFRQSLKMFLFGTYWCIQCIRGFMTMHYINQLFTYLLTITINFLTCSLTY